MVLLLEAKDFAEFAVREKCFMLTKLPGDGYAREKPLGQFLAR